MVIGKTSEMDIASAVFYSTIVPHYCGGVDR